MALHVSLSCENGCGGSVHGGCAVPSSSSGFWGSWQPQLHYRPTAEEEGQ